MSSTFERSNRPSEDDRIEPQVLPFSEVGYEELARILSAAYEQSATGKGRSRHGKGRDFVSQPIMTIGRMTGIGGHMFQIMKKAQEAQTMASLSKDEAAINELRGVIIYAAAAILLIEEKLRKP